jgi:protein arginine kinase activator
MKCEACNKHEASVQVKQVADGMVKEVYLCAGCAEKSGMKSPAAMADFLFGVGSLPSGSAPKASKSCPGCHMRSSDFQKNSRLGCAQCYDTFSDELTPMVESMHRAQRHTGKAPAREAVRAEVDGLQAKLQHAVQQQNFESAAEIRDEIKALESHVS